VTAPARFRFGEFVLSPRQRLLMRNGAAVPLIPKYFDLLRLLVEQRRDAVSKQAIFDHVWADVIVSDGALSQAVRTLRRTLGDDSREPRYIRTVSRHGYQFVWTDVVEELDDGLTRTASEVAEKREDENTGSLVDRLIAVSGNRDESAEAREIAERLHVLGTDAAVAALSSRPGHAAALAWLRDARWSVPTSGAVPIVGDREAFATVLALVRLRLSAVKRTVARRWAAAALAGGAGGGIAGAVGGLVLYLSPGSRALPESALALAAIGAAAGSIGAAGIGAGLTAAEGLARSRRGPALALCGAAAGAIVGTLAHVVLRALLDSLFGLPLEYAQSQLGNALDGLVIGGAAGCGYATATRQPPGGGLAAPTGARRLIAAAIVGAWCAAAATLLALSGRLLVGGLVHEIARSSQNAQLVLAPLGRLIGEPGFGAVTRTILSALEGASFGAALAWGLTARPARRPAGDD